LSSEAQSPLLRDEGRAVAPFIVGVNRSGTTLLRLMLDAHPDLAIPPETHFLPELIRRANHGNTRLRIIRSLTAHPRWGDFGVDPKDLRKRTREIKPLSATAVARAFYELYAESQGKPRWGDKTPRYMRSMPRIARALPEARFVHIIRDGRDVAISQAERSLEERDTPVEEAAERWARRIEAAREAGREMDVYMEVRYEDLVAEPEATLRKVCEFVELPFDAGMLDYHRRAADRLAEMDRDLAGAEGPVRLADERLAGHALTTEPPTTERCGRWRTEMTPDEIARFDAAAGGLLEQLGYERSGDPAARKEMTP
jgi:hypothetical protein